MHTLGFPFTQVTGDRGILTRRNEDGTKRTGGDTFTAADAAFFIDPVNSQGVVPLNGIGWTRFLTGRVGTLPAGDRVINEFRLEFCYFNSGKSGVEYLIVGKGTDQLADPATRALYRETTFLKRDLFSDHADSRAKVSL